MTQIDPIALFRLSVLGPLISRPLQRGEFQKTLWELAGREYAIPGSRRTRLSHKTIAGWYYAWRKDSIDGLSPRPRRDQGQSKLAAEIQEAILRLKRENPRRSLLQILQALESTGQVSRGTVSRSAIHRLLQRHGLSRPAGAASEPEEKRSFVADCAGAIWYGDVMHGPQISLHGKRRKAASGALRYNVLPVSPRDSSASRPYPHRRPAGAPARSASWTQSHSYQKPSARAPHQFSPSNPRQVRIIKVFGLGGHRFPTRFCI